jgi:hypothetical protein
MKRFSWMAFIVATLLHLYGTSLLIEAGIRDAHASQLGQPEHLLLKTTASWVWLPVPMLLKPLFEYHGPVSHDWPPKLPFPWMMYIALSWSFVIGACFGFIVPRLFRWRRRTVLPNT